MQFSLLDLAMNDTRDGVNFTHLIKLMLLRCWVGFGKNVIEVATDQWRDHLRSCMHAGGGHFEHML